MFNDLFSWQSLAAACVAILGIMVSAAIYAWIGHPKIIWLGVFCVIGLELCAANYLIKYLEKRKDNSPDQAHGNAPSAENAPPSIIPMSNPIPPTSLPSQSTGVSETKVSSGPKIVLNSPEVALIAGPFAITMKLDVNGNAREIFPITFDRDSLVLKAEKHVLKAEAKITDGEHIVKILSSADNGADIELEPLKNPS